MVGPLALIWMTALGCVFFSFFTLAGLIVARVLREREERENPERRARMSKALLSYVVAGEQRPAFTLLQRTDRQILIDVALDAALVLQDTPGMRLIAFLQEIGLDEALRRQAMRGSVRDRINAIEALRLFTGEQTIKALCAAERSSDLRIWLRALQTRATLGAGPDMAGLLAIAARPGASRSTVMQDLITARAKTNLGEALRVLKTSLPSSARSLLVRAIGETKRVEALDALKLILLHPDAQTRTAAAGALGALGQADAAGALVRASRDVDWRVRLKAVESMRRLGLWREAYCLEPLLRDRVWWVRFRAEEALCALVEDGAHALKGISTVQPRHLDLVSRSARR